MDSPSDLVHKQVGSYVIRIIAVILAIEAAFYLESKFNLLHRFVGALPSPLAPYVAYIDHTHLVSVLSALIYVVVVYILVFVLNRVSEERQIRGRYVSLPDADPNQINIFDIKANLFSFGHTLVGEEYKIAAAPARSGSWRSRSSLDVRIEKNSATVMYIYYGESNDPAFVGHGFTTMTLRDDATGNGYWLDDKLGRETKSTHYFKVTRHLRKAMVIDAGLIAKARAVFPWKKADVVRAYAALAPGHTLRKRPARLP